MENISWGDNSLLHRLVHASLIVDIKRIRVPHKSGRIAATLKFTKGTTRNTQIKELKYLLLDVVLIIVLIVLFELCHRVFNFLDELFS